MEDAKLEGKVDDYYIKFRGEETSPKGQLR
jgi:hypothetical protein